ncbi:MAG: hypothetical protein WBN85_07360 [Candidatus Macondimonas sp.]
MCSGAWKRRARYWAGASSREQFALPEAAGLLRTLARQPGQGEQRTLSAADPLNLAGILTPGERVPSFPGRHVFYRDGQIDRSDKAAESLHRAPGP